MIATFQTLGDKQASDAPAAGDAAKEQTIDTTFFLKHYPPGYFDVIVIDECHRSAWGKWFVILENNKQAIQIGLTATPRRIKVPETRNPELAKQLAEDKRLLADNLKYFGEPPYEYTYAMATSRRARSSNTTFITTAN